nr:MAG TPA: hypothetical protein [Caudoviricetes sp.]
MLKITPGKICQLIPDILSGGIAIYNKVAHRPAFVVSPPSNNLTLYTVFLDVCAGS